MKIKQATPLTEQKWVNLFDVAYEGKDGRLKSWQIATRHGAPKCISGDFVPPDAVVIVPFHVERGQLVITREYRVPLAGVEYGFPAGLVDHGETLQEAAIRELQEETGLAVTRILKIGPPVYSSAGMSDESVSMVYVECAGEVSTAGNQASEQIEVLFVSPTDAARLCRNPALKFDAKAWLVLTAFAEEAMPFQSSPEAR